MRFVGLRGLSLGNSLFPRLDVVRKQGIQGRDIFGVVL